jgi:hypothetical protein
VRELAWYLLISFAVGFQTRGVLAFLDSLSDKIGDYLKK